MSTAPRRTRFGWAALGLVAGLLAAGVPAVSAPAKPAARKAVPESLQVLVRIGQETITRADVQRRVESLPEQFRSNYTTPEGRQQLLDRMIEERVWHLQAIRAGVSERPQVKQQIEQQKRDLLIRTHLNELMATAPAVTDSEAMAWYDSHPADYRVPASATLRHILLKKESDAKFVRNQARTKDWNDLVKRWSTDSLTRASGGSLGTVTRDGQFAVLGSQPALAESAFALQAGQVGGPYRTDRGWHVIKVDAIKEESVRPFDQVKQIITRQLGSQRSQDFYKEKLEEARRATGVRPDSSAIRGFVCQKKTARERFNEAQAAGSPQSRIEAYQALLRDFPDSDVSPQAQFMIGFINSEELKDYDAAETAFKALLQRWPKAELAASAQWMIEHMRSEEAPPFVNVDGDSVTTEPAPKGKDAKAGSRQQP